jgi:hypothetical protein
MHRFLGDSVRTGYSDSVPTAIFATGEEPFTDFDRTGLPDPPTIRGGGRRSRSFPDPARSRFFTKPKKSSEPALERKTSTAARP